MPYGTWRARWREVPGGPQRTRHFDRKTDAETFLVKLRHDQLSGSYIDPSLSRTTVADYYRTWQERQVWRASSRAAIGAVFRIRVLPVMGSRPLSAVKRADIEAWAQRLPLSPSSVATARQYLGTMFLAAVEDGLLARNPCKGARLPKVEKAPVVPLTADEVHRLEDAAPPLLRAAIVRGAGTGLRQGEVTGLTLDRVAFLQRSVRVDRQLVTPPTGAPYLGPPKTAASYPQRPAAGSRPRGTGRAGAEVR